MSDCLICQIIEGKIPSKKVYEDDEITAILDVNGASPGHCFVIPKKHYAIMEQVPDKLIGRMFSIANTISTSIFDELRSHGTNIFVMNGIPAGQRVAHFMINVVPRQENDKVNLSWQPRQLSEEEMSTVELRLKEHADMIGGFAASPEANAEKERLEPMNADEGEDNYILKSMNKLP